MNLQLFFAEIIRTIQDSGYVPFNLFDPGSWMPGRVWWFTAALGLFTIIGVALAAIGIWNLVKGEGLGAAVVGYQALFCTAVVLVICVSVWVFVPNRAVIPNQKALSNDAVECLAIANGKGDLDPASATDCVDLSDAVLEASGWDNTDDECQSVAVGTLDEQVWGAILKGVETGDRNGVSVRRVVKKVNDFCD